MTDSQRRALQLSYFTVGYNVVEGLVSVAAGLAAGSTALFGFGVDSFVESLSGAVMIWRFGKAGTISKEESERRERQAVKLVGYALLILSAYVAYGSASKLYFGEPPDRSLLGIIIALVSLAVMPALFYMKRHTAAQVASRSLLADARQTLACMLLSVALLAGLGLNYLMGWWQADPIAGLVIAGLLVRESRQALTHKELCRD